jgi:AcrR family transcriptional regulator
VCYDYDIMARNARRPTRRTQEERRARTQAAILKAAIALLIESGYSGFSAARVAGRAGVSRGAQEHYYPTKHKLIAATTQQAMNEALGHARSLARSASHSRDPVAKFLLDSEHFFFNPLFRALIEIMVAARSDKVLARLCYPIVRKARVELNKLWTDTLAGAGYRADQARQFVELTHYLLRGVFLVATWLPYGVDRRQAIAAWRKLIPSILPARLRA